VMWTVANFIRKVMFTVPLFLFWVKAPWIGLIVEDGDHLVHHYISFPK
jgi:hypothetical protein